MRGGAQIIPKIAFTPKRRRRKKVSYFNFISHIVSRNPHSPKERLLLSVDDHLKAAFMGNVARNNTTALPNLRFTTLGFFLFRLLY
ncbi:hypothetical protein CEXT_187651 [Caerostris extrusa]|uniref:Uncharacterized protein n=1 Tax=Caerostris extrusa TaxID=172846 RepID=A0AAV4WYE1_CAEEX|nr:hypothetical protein CEXT_187651 [Caerostris extrusa]